MNHIDEEHLNKALWGAAISLLFLTTTVLPAYAEPGNGGPRAGQQRQVGHPGQAQHPQGPQHSANGPQRQFNGNREMRHDRDNNPPGRIGGPGTNWENRPGPQGGPGASPNRRDNDNNPPGRLGGPGTNWENRPGPQGGPGYGPDRNSDRQINRREFMKQADANGDGTVDQAERQAGRDAWLEQHPNAHGNHDMNSDGTVNADDLRQFRDQKRENHYQQRLEKWDANGDGTLDQTEKEQAKAARNAKLQERLAQWDSNGDGKIGPVERRNAIKAKRQNAANSGDSETETSDQGSQS